jgi:Protein of unknown function (DUF2815)
MNEQEILTSPEVRGFYVHIAKPVIVNKETGKTQYQITIALPKRDKVAMRFKENLEKLMQEASSRVHGGTGVPKQRLKHYPIIDGDNQTSEKENEAFHDHWIVRCKGNFRPSIVDKKSNELLTDDEIYSGAWYKVRVSPYAWFDPNKGKGVSVGIISMLKTKDDTRFGGGENAKQAFADDIEQDANDDSADDVELAL